MTIIQRGWQALVCSSIALASAFGCSANPANDEAIGSAAQALPVTSCQPPFVLPNVFVSDPSQENANSDTNGNLFVYAAGTGGFSKSAVTTQQSSSLTPFSGTAFANAEVSVGNAFTSAGGSLAVTLAVQNSAGATVCSNTTPLPTGGRPSFLLPQCQFTRPIGGDSFSIRIELEAHGPLVWDSATANIKVSSASFKLCDDLVEIVDAENNNCVTAGASVGSPAQGFACTGQPTQFWKFERDGSVRAPSGLCLQTEPSTGTAVLVDTCGLPPLASNRKWDPIGTSPFFMTSSRACLTAMTGAAGEQLVLNRCFTGGHQIWR